MGFWNQTFWVCHGFFLKHYGYIYFPPPKTKKKLQPPRLVAARTFGGAAVAACMQADLRDRGVMGPIGVEDHFLFWRSAMLEPRVSISKLFVMFQE